MCCKRWFYLIFAVLLVSALILGSFGCAKPAPPPAPAPAPKPAPAPTPQIPPPGARPIKITYAGGMPLGTILPEGQKMFKKLIEKKSKGVITVELYLAGQLFKHEKMPGAIQLGAVDMAVPSMIHYEGTCPAGLVAGIPAGFEVKEQWVRFLDGPYFQIMDSELGQVNAKLVGWQYYGGGMGIISKEPVRTIDDLRKIKIRGQFTIGNVYLHSLGVTSVAMASAEVYTALQRGTIAGAFSGVSTFVSRKWMEPCKYVILPPNEGSFMYTIWGTVYNRDKWNALPTWAQDMITECTNEVWQWQLVEGDKQDKEHTAKMR